MPKVRVINPLDKDNDILRVAAYCRVSSDSEDQLNSYAAQISYWTDHVENTDGWELVDVYADEGISGTQAERREEFQNLMRDARRGKIDVILCKSISRFSRNTADCLLALRELKEIGVTVRLEKENIDTATLSSELLASLFAALAQEESISISRNQRWSYQGRMQRGEFITCSAPFGYELLDGKRMRIVESEAKTVRWMFSSYLAGISGTFIADELTAMGIPSPTGKSTWQRSTVIEILQNEKYVGDALLQKTYSTDFPFKCVRNKGEKEQYYVENSHPPIIDRNTFERVQELRHSRKPPVKDHYAHYPLSKKITCEICGSTFKRRETKNGLISWVCAGHDKNKNLCTTGRIAETEFHDAFIRMYRKLKNHADIILLPVISQLEALTSAIRRENPKHLEINRELTDATGISLVLQRLRSDGLIDPETYMEKSNEVNGKIIALRQQRRRLMAADDDDDIEQSVKRLIQTVEDGPDDLDTFDEELFSDMVGGIITESQERIRFRLAGGLEFTENIRRTQR